MVIIKKNDQFTESDQNLVLGIFLLILAVSGNFVAETLSCKTQKLLSESMLAKNLVIILVIYFALGITNDEENKRPDLILIDALKVYVFFLIFNKMELPFVMVVFGMIATLLIIYNWRQYFLKNDQEEVAEKLSTSMNGIIVTTLIVTLIGFILYFKKQYTDYKGDFSILKFIFGKTSCASMK